MPALPPGADTVIHDGTATLSVTGARQGTVDLMAFQLTVDQRVRNDNDFIFFNQPKSPEGAVRLIGADRISLDLSFIPSHIHALSIAVALDESVSGSLATVPGLDVTLEQPTGLVVQAPASGLRTERAAILMEVYRRNGTWKVRNVSQGWSTGLTALATNYGGDVSQPAPPTPTPAPTPSPAPTPRPTPTPAPTTERRGVPPSRPRVQPPAAPPVTLSKITLDKNTPSVSLVKAGEEQGLMRVNLNWTTRDPARGSWVALPVETASTSISIARTKWQMGARVSSRLSARHSDRGTTIRSSSLMATTAQVPWQMARTCTSTCRIRGSSNAS